MLDVMLTHHTDVLMVHVEIDNKIVQFSLHVIHTNHIDVYQEDVLKMPLNVNNLINYYNLVKIT